MKYLVTGASGFIGNAMVNYLKDKDNYVRGIDIKYPQFSESKADEFERKDLRIYSNCLEVTKDIDRVYDFSANMGGIGFITSKDADILNDNVKINANLLKASVMRDVKRLFFSSSACVYPEDMQQDSSEVINLKEEDAYPVNPGTGYGWEKHFTEIMCKAFLEDYGLETRITRFHNIYGPYGTYEGGREKAPAAICRKISRAEDNTEVTIWGTGKAIRSFLFIDDCVEANYKLMNSNYSEPLNIGNDEAIRIEELTKMIIDISNKELEISHDLSKPVGVKSRNADLTKIKEILDWEPTVGYREGLKRTYEWIREQDS